MSKNKMNELKRSMQAWGVNQLRETTGQTNKEQRIWVRNNKGEFDYCCSGACCPTGLYHIYRLYAEQKKCNCFCGNLNYIVDLEWLK